MTARMSSELRILYSLPSSLISVPPYLLTSTRSPFLTSNGNFLAVVVGLAGAERDDDAFLRFFLGGIGDDDSALL